MTSIRQIRTFVIILSLFAVLLICDSATAITANPNPISAQQPDGTEITIRLRGDEMHNWFEDTKGYLVVKDSSGFFKYAKFDKGKLVATELIVGKDEPKGKGVPKDIQPPKSKPAMFSVPSTISALGESGIEEPSGASVPPPQRLIPPIQGEYNNLVILCLFNDHSGDEAVNYTRGMGDYEVLFNTVGGDPGLAPTGSVIDYFTETSYGDLTLNSIIVDWVTLPETQDYYTNGMYGLGAYPQNAQRMVEDALNELEPLLANATVEPNQLDFDGDGYIDAIDIIHSGYGAEFDGDLYKIWSHYWQLPQDWISPSTGLRVREYHTEPALYGDSGTDITHIGVICHETGHYFGLPDLYDTDGSSAGIGCWGLMGNAWGFANDQYYPPHFCAWSKTFLGWVTPTVISDGGEYQVPQIQTDTSRKVYRIDMGFPIDEYLLIENRQAIGFDEMIPHGGLAIWHIDDAKGDFEFNDVNADEGYPGQPGWPENGSHYRVALLQADGLYELETNWDGFGDYTDLYYNPNATELDHSTVPNTDTYQFGIVDITGVSIFEISDSQDNMTFMLWGESIGRVLNKTTSIIYDNIQDAIDAAKNGEELIAHHDSLYTEMIDFKGKAITLRSGDVDNPDNPAVSPENTIIRGNYTSSIVTFQSGEGLDTVLNGFTITAGFAENGAGIECIFSSPTIKNCIIEENQAVSYGGGIDLWFSHALIENCTVRNNIAWSGGGINIDSDDVGSLLIKSCWITGNASLEVGGGISCYYTPGTIKNCIIAENDASDAGGGIYLWASDPEISNCNVIDNIGADDLGGIYRDFDNPIEPTIFNSIIWNNGDDLFACSATYSCIEDTDSGIGNIHEDPNFIGPYYLSFDGGYNVGQFVTSPCFDVGDPSLALADLDLENTTTRTDHQVDTGIVDMGYHREATPAPTYELTATAINGTIDPEYTTATAFTQYTQIVFEAESTLPLDLLDRVRSWTDTDDDTSTETTNIATMDRDRDVVVEFEYWPQHLLTVTIIGTHGTVEISDPQDLANTIPALRARYYEDDIVQLKGVPDEGYRVKAWTGTDDDPSWNSDATVTMTDNKIVTVEFEEDVTNYLLVPSNYPTLIEAIEAAQSGDVIVLAPRPGQPYPVLAVDGLDFEGKHLILTSTDPDDPQTIADTIIDCQGSRYSPHRAFYFHSGEDTDVVIQGITIQNAFYGGDFGAHGVIPNPPYPPDQNPEAPPQANSGEDAMGDGYGGAILCENESSPTIRNCVFRNCIIAGAVGGDGDDGAIVIEGTNGDGQSGGDGGFAYGNGGGGAIACLSGSSPIIENCQFIGNMAQGSLGGQGGDGSDADGSGRGSWGGDGGISFGSSSGGAIYVDMGCWPIISNCLFENNSSTDGEAGTGGSQGAGNNYPEPYDVFTDGYDGFAFGSMAGGAIYYEYGIENLLVNCKFKENTAASRSGAIYAGPDNILTIQDCEFDGNQGGGLYFSDGGELVVNDCQFVNNSDGGAYIGLDCVKVEFNNTVFRSNSAFDDGAAIDIKSDASFVNCDFSENIANGYGGAINAYIHVPGPDINTITLNFNQCGFSNNECSEMGGGFYGKNIIIEITDSHFINNTAQSGGGAYFDESELAMSETRFAFNTATGRIYNHYPVEDEGFGGALSCMTTTTSIVSCIFTDNKTTGGQSSGGAIHFDGAGGYITHELVNCLITGNEAGMLGGGLYCQDDVAPVIENCTFASNTAGGFGGGIYIDWSSLAVITNTIFSGCTNHAVYEEQPDGNAETTYCLFYKNSGGDYYDAQTGISATGAASINAFLGNAGNVDDDPFFIDGPLGQYYLTQATSGAVDMGSTLASSIGYDILTTDTLGQLDSGMVDIGYHYPDPQSLVQYQLDVSVVLGHGTFIMEPDLSTYYDGMFVKITALPDDSYRVDTWSGGTIDDSSKELVNYVLMDSDKQIEITFDQPRTLLVRGPDITNVQRAIEEAEDGDIIMIEPGNYESPTPALGIIEFLGKDITLTSMNPDDPAVVEATVMDNHYFLLVDVSQESSIEGIKFINGTMYLQNSDLIIRNCVFAECNFFTPDAPDPLNVCANDGIDASGLEGGAMEIYESSPKIINCTFDDCTVRAGSGSNGIAGCEAHPPGGDGGWGGYAYGGAVYIAFSSTPEFIHCTFTDNFAEGGNGGDGGNGYQTANGGRGGNWLWADYIEEGHDMYMSWWDGWTYGDKYDIGLMWFDEYDWDQWQEWFGWDRYSSWDDFAANFDPFNPDPYDRYEDYWRYGGYGGAVYCEYDCNVKFIECTFTDNFSISGLTGLGGGTVPEPTPNRRMNIPTAGGAVYAAHDSRLEFTDCLITGNVANYIVTGDDPEDYYFSYGGGVAADFDCEVIFNNTIIGENVAAIGGGVYTADSAIEIADSNFIENEAYHGGGLYTDNVTGTVSGTYFITNRATLTALAVELGADDNLVVVFPNTQMGGQGGGYFAFTSPVEVKDSIFLENGARVSGGGIYLGGSDQDNIIHPSLRNNLFIGNHSGRDGGAVSANWYIDLTLSSCTITENAVTGAFGETLGFGGGLYASYNSFVTVIDTIIWDNLGVNGSQIAIGSGDEFGPKPSTVNISYSDVGPITDPDATIYVPFDPTDPLYAEPSENVPPEQVIEEDTINHALTSTGTAKVIVTLFEPEGVRESVDWDSPASMLDWQDQVSQLQSEVLSTMNANDFTLRYQFENQAGFSCEVNQAGFDALVNNPNVRFIEPVRPIQRMMAQGITLANATAARQFFDGTGVAVAIVDDAVDYMHPALGSGTFPNSKVIGGYDFGQDDADPAPVAGTGDLHAHGTCVAGIAAGSAYESVQMEDYIGGVAHNAKIYALKISDEAGNLTFDAGLAAWDWCLTHRLDDPDNPLLVINNSWGTPAVTNDMGLADILFPAMTIAVDNLVASGVTVMAASGNSYAAGQGISFPAAMSKVISVGAVYDTTDMVTEYSNTSTILDILAPADPLYTTDVLDEDGYNAEGDYYPDFGGTSAACPFAVGCVAAIQSAAIQEAGRYLSPVEIKTLLIETGDPVTDTKVDITKPRVNLGMAIAGIRFGSPIHVETDSVLSGWDQETLTWDPEYNILIDDPNFVGDYFLSQITGGQLFDSICVDTGSDLAANIGLDQYTTNVGMIPDKGMVDMGYHHRIGDDVAKCKRLDFVYDGHVVLDDFAVLALYWMELCDSPDWCEDTDVNADTTVDVDDVISFAGCWLAEDTEAPTPNPAQWALEPVSELGNPTIWMRTKKPSDNWARTDKIGQPDEWKYEYKFERVSSQGTVETEWLSSPDYVDSGLILKQVYTYRTKVRDLSINLNETEWSVAIAVAAGVDSTPPEPNPSLWATLEHDGVDGRPAPSGPDSIRMTAYASTDPSGPVQYFFSCTEGKADGGDDSGWQLQPFYEDDGLVEGVVYTYTVKARDALGNETIESVPASAMPDGTIIPDDTPPDPDPPVWEVLPTKQKINNVWYHYMRVEAATDESGVEYYFECMDASSLDSGWQSEPGVDPLGDPTEPNEYWVAVGSEFLNYTYRVKARDMSINQNETDWSEPAMVP